MQRDDLLEPFERIVAAAVTPEAVREVQRTADVRSLWQPIEESGFLDALVPEDAGGAGLRLCDIVLLVEALGRHAAPAPIAQTMAARALLALAGMAAPRGPIVLATTNGSTAQRVQNARVASHALVDCGTDLWLVAIVPDRLTQDDIHVSLADVALAAGNADRIASQATGRLRSLAAVLHAAEIAGLGARVLDMTARYADDRVQFGRPIARQQAIQQQIAVMAEKVMMAHMAACIGMNADLLPDPAAAATAKAVASAAAVEIATIAHATHGAIGISEEHDLQLYTRRLHEHRVADGSESYWSDQLGTSRLADDAPTSVDFIRSAIDWEAK